MLLRQIEQLFCQNKLVGFDSAFSNWNPLRHKKCVRHGAADQNSISFFQQRLEHADFIRNLRAAHDNEEWLRWTVELFVQIFQFLFHQEAHGAFRNEFRDADRAGVGAVGRAEGVIDVKIA